LKDILFFDIAELFFTEVYGLAGESVRHVGRVLGVFEGIEAHFDNRVNLTIGIITN
jgi:hypothetical protein